MKALLDQLRTSQAYLDATSGGVRGQNVHGASPESEAAFTGPSGSTVREEQGSTSVASLLEQLRTPAATVLPPPAAHADLSGPPQPAALPALPPPQPATPRRLTFQQALPQIAALADDPKFVAAVEKVQCSSFFSGWAWLGWAVHSFG